LRILIQETGLSDDEAPRVFDEAGSNLSVALVMSKAKRTRVEAVDALKKANGKVEEAVKALES